MSPAEGAAEKRAPVLLVEGESDRVALRSLAARLGLAAPDERIVPMGGITNLARFLATVGPDVPVGVLHDAGEEPFVARTLARSDRPVASYRCTRDLEDALVGGLGVERTLAVIEDAGDLARWHTLRNQPHHRTADERDVLRRFFGTTSGRKARYAELLAAALDPDDVPAELCEALRFLDPPQEQTHTHQLAFTDTEVTKSFVSTSRGEPDREWACLQVLAEHAPGLAPRPLRRDGDALILERLAGVPLGGAPLTREQTAALATALRRLYAVPLAAVRAAGIGERHGGPTRLRSDLCTWLADDVDLAPCQDPPLVGGAVAAARRWLAPHDALPAPRLTVLGIADLNPANVLWNGAGCRLVDFEDAGLSEPAFELADHVEHLAGRRHGVYDPEALVAAVGLDAAATDRFERYRTAWAVFWLVMLLPGNGGFARNPAGTTEAQARYVLARLR